MTETPTPSLAPQQVQAAQMLATGIPTHEIVSELDISESTLYRWKKKKAFKELIENIITSELAETKFRMAHLVDASLNALWDIVMEGKNEYTRLYAALHVLKLAGVARIVSPNVTQAAEYILKSEPEEADKIVITNAAGESRMVLSMDEPRGDDAFPA